MTGTGADRKILVLWLIAIGMITTRELRSTDLPAPSAYLGSAIVYGMAAILAEAAPSLAVVAAAGWTLAIAYGLLQDRRGGASPGRATVPARRGPVSPERKGVR